MKRNVLARRAASAALAACMMFTLSAPALAASTDALLQQSTAAKSAVSVLDEENGMMEEPVYDEMDLNRGSITVYIGDDGKQYAKQGENEAQQRGNLQITTNGGQTPNTLTIRGGDSTAAKVTLSNVNINASGAAVSVSGNVELIIAGTNTNTLRSGTNHAGVEKADDNGTLTISGTGTLNAYGGEHGAGIGGVWDRGASNIVIEGGTIEAHGGRWGAGIGGGHGAAGQNITIRDGNVTAIPGGEAAGIGGGYMGSGKNITIESGTVHAESGGGNGPVAAIGGGRVSGKGENIRITGGNVTVKSGTGVWIGGTNAEISKSSLTGAVTYLDGSGSVVDEVVQDYDLEVGAENTTPIPVTSKNYQDILGNGVLSYDPTTQTLKSNGRIQRSSLKINAPGKDINLDGKDQIAVAAKLIVVNAHNVTISSNKFAAIFARDDTSTINCTGKVDIRSGGNMVVNGSLSIKNSDDVDLYANGNSISSKDLTITSGGNVTIESTDGSAAKNLTINNAENVTVIINDTQAISENTKITASGTVILKNTAEDGRVGTVDFTPADGKKNYVYYTSEGADEGAIDASVTPIPSDVPYRYLRIEEKQNASIKVNNGTVTVGDTTGTQLNSFKGQKVKVTATGAESDDRKFDGWEVVAPAGFTIDADKLREKSFEFIMPAGKVELTAHYASRLSVTGGTAKVKGEQVDFARKGAAVTVTADDRSTEGYQFDHWVVSSGDIGKTEEELKANPLNFTMPDAAVKLTAVYSAAVTVVNGIAEAGTKSGETIFVLQGETVTVSGKNRNPDVATFGGWKVVSPEDFELTEEQENTEKNMTFIMPDSPVKLKASYSFPAPVLDMPVTVKGGTIRVGEGERQTGTVLVQPGQTVTIEADEPAKENESFHHWKVEKDSSKNIGIIEGSLGSETEKGTGKIVFTMPQDGVKLTAVYSIPASVLKSTVTVENGTAKSTLDEGSDIPAEIGTTVEITATPYDAKEHPGMEFVEWEIKYPDSFYKNFPDGIPEELQLKLDNAKSAATTFEMPAYPVKLIAHWSASAVVKPDPDEPFDEDFGVEPAPMDTTGGAIAAVAVGGAAIWGGYEIATRVILHNLLPEGAAIPANRGQLALLVWNTAGRPEPAGTPAFADVTDPDMAKAAQWCTEQGIMDAKGDRFEPEGWTPKFKVIEVWNKAFPKQ